MEHDDCAFVMIICLYNYMIIVHFVTQYIAIQIFTVCFLGFSTSDERVSCHCCRSIQFWVHDKRLVPVHFSCAFLKLINIGCESVHVDTCRQDGI